MSVYIPVVSEVAKTATAIATSKDTKRIEKRKSEAVRLQSTHQTLTKLVELGSSTQEAMDILVLLDPRATKKAKEKAAKNLKKAEGRTE